MCRHLATKLKPLTDKQDITPNHDTILLLKSPLPDIHVEIPFKTLKLTHISKDERS